MSENLRPARIVPPGRILERELEERGWTQRDLAEIMGRPPQAINEIVRGVKQITPETAIELAAAFDTSPEFWINLEANYRLRRAQQYRNGNDQRIVRRRRLFSLAPIAELIKRRWIRASENIDELEQEVCRFFGLSSLEETPSFTASFRHASEGRPEYPAQMAWIRRAQQLGSQQVVVPFDQERLQQALPMIRGLARRVEDVAQVPQLLRDIGVRFVIVPHLPRTYIDGALCTIEAQPIIALSLRYDRIDAFWFTLMHELAHLALGHREFHLDSLDDREGNRDAHESQANQQARAWLIDQQDLQSFVAHTQPYFSRTKIVHFAEAQGVHPGIVLGQLQYDQVVSYKHLRGLLVKVSPFLADWIDAVPD